MATARISKGTVDAAAPAANEDQFLWDDELRGFGLKITPKGAKSYVLQYRMGGRETHARRYTIGTHGTWTPDLARKEAKRLKMMVDQGVDPQAADKERQRVAVDLAFDKYVAHFIEQYGRKQWKPRTLHGNEVYLWRVAKVFGSKPLPSIKRTDIVALFDGGDTDKVGAARNMYSVTRGCLPGR